jgi:hemoglobin
MTSLYEKLGGEPAVDAEVDIFYGKVLADSRVNGFFEGTDMDKQIRKQKNFLTFAFGGPKEYSGVGLRNAHKKLVEEQGLADEHFEIIMQHLGATLTELNVLEI